MSKVCEICGKAPVAGRSTSHSHRVSNRTFRPNIQKITVKVDGKVKRAKAFKRHILNKKTRKTKRNLRRTAYVSQSYAGTMKKLIPYK